MDKIKGLSFKKMLFINLLIVLSIVFVITIWSYKNKPKEKDHICRDFSEARNIFETTIMHTLQDNNRENGVTYDSITVYNSPYNSTDTKKMIIKSINTINDFFQ